MACVNPISIMVKSHPHREPYSVAVPCGKCFACLKDYQNQWMLRLSEEAKSHSRLLFFTLTYRERHDETGKKTVPCYVDSNTGEVFRTVNKKHVQDWLKRYRTTLSRAGKPTNFKYFITSEYGPITLRPHYHGLIFGIGLNDFTSAKLDWQVNFGFVKVDEISLLNKDDIAGVTRYVSKYCSKGDFENPLVKEGKVDKTFHLISKGIGVNYVKTNRNYHLLLSDYHNPNRVEIIAERLKFQYQGFIYKLPRYYKEKLIKPKSILSVKVADILLQKSIDLYNQQLAELQSTRHCSEVEANCILLSKTANDTEFQDLQTKNKLASFYQKSKL